MGTVDRLGQIHQETRIPRWNRATRIAFRFCFAYFTLYSVTRPILSDLFVAPKFSIPYLETVWPMRQITFWSAAHIFGITHPLIYSGSGSGDKTFNWVEAFCVLLLSVAATAAWSVLDRRRQDYVTLNKWFRVFLRFALAAEMFSYGAAKIIPLQMPFPFLTRWVEPFGNFSPMGVLWNSIGASPAYEMFAGCAETLGGILLIVPRTTLLGVLICLADLTQVFLINVTYDVPVKLFSFHLILIALLLLAPDLRRLADFFFLNRAVGPPVQSRLFHSRRANRIAVAVQIIFGIYLAGINIYNSESGWYAFGDGRPKSAFYGIWNVDQLSIDGQVRPPLLTDNERWRRVIFDFPASMNFQGMDDSFTGYGASINVNDKTIALTKGTDKSWKANFTFQRPAQDQLILDGDFDKHSIHMQLQLVERNKFPLANRDFHWIAEYPHNRLEVRR